VPSRRRSARNWTRSSAGLAGLEREVAALHADYAALSVRLDNLDRRVGRIEARLELVELPTPEPI